ncbi:MAG TPA: UDP-glucose 4-epimerase GalE [Candidatus Hungatella pullicola]|nr:UDP-glucose 4-epimerase GalE [Candidatus Hungatella pullicola]
MKILVTGGAGYIGSHTCVQLLEQGYEVAVMDNLSNSSEEALRRVEKITGRSLTFYETDLLDEKGVDSIFEKEKIDGVIHFAGLKAVGESVAKPLEYYHNNITGTLILCDAMRRHGVKKIIFSSSATVYGDPAFVPITEECPKGKITNPYGQTKAMLEQILTDLHSADPQWSVILLRYFNPVGAHKSGLIGEDPAGIPNNLTPYITQVAVGRLKEVGVFGNDYDTPDGTGVRDYIHVVDLAIGHVKALEKIYTSQPDVRIYNLGTGRGYSVLQMIEAFSKACGKKIPYVIKERRPGDIAQCYADASLAEKELGFKAERGIDEMCEDAWRWQHQNPQGYRS